MYGALSTFRPYLYGRRFKIVSDHKPLSWIMSVKDPGTRLRWRIKLEEYDYETVYKPGVQNSNADALSRIGALASEGNDSDEIDSDMKLKILQENHDSILGGHRGMNKTYESIKRHYRWPNMKREIEDYVKACTKCQINRPKKRAPMEIQTGQKVLLFGETVRRGRSKKLSPQYVGPYEVLAVDGVNNDQEGPHHTKGACKQSTTFLLIKVY